MERRAICRAGEEHAKYRCESIDTDEAVLKKAYAENPSVLKFLEISRDWDYGNVPPPQHPQPKLHQAGLYFGGPGVNCGPTGGLHEFYPLHFAGLCDARGRDWLPCRAFAQRMAQPQEAMSETHVVSAPGISSAARPGPCSRGPRPSRKG